MSQGISLEASRVVIANRYTGREPGTGGERIGTHEHMESILQGLHGLLFGVVVLSAAANTNQFGERARALGRHRRPERVWLEFGGVRVGLELGEVEVVVRGESELGVAMRDGDIALFVFRVGGEGVGVVVRHGGGKRGAWEAGTCEIFHMSGAAAEILPWPSKSLETGVLE
jgi:hypothetical protein